METPSTDEPTMWERFEGHGSGSFTDAELEAMLEEVQQALPLLEARHGRYCLTLEDVMRTRQRLMDCKRHRALSADWKNA